MRRSKLFLAILLFSSPALAVEESDVLFFAPFEGKADAAMSAGDGAAALIGPQQYGEGLRGKAIAVEPQTLLSYVFEGNCVPDEGTVMMWVKPQWSPDDGQFHHLFRASTGNFQGKALNALLVYEYIKGERLQFYTSNGQETEPQDGRSLAFVDPIQWKPGQWHHIAATWSATLASTEQVLYVDGQRAATASGAVFVPDETPERFEIGGPRGTATTWCDDVILFSRPLLAGEVASVYEAYRAGKSDDPESLPFASTRELQLRPYILFGSGQFVVEVDYRGARRELGEQPGPVQLTLRRGNRQWTRNEPADPRIGAVRFQFSYDEIGDGPCEIQVALAKGEGEALRDGRLEYQVPARPVWLGNDLGKTNQVLPPWPPIRVESGKVHTWGREYAFSAVPVPERIVSQGEEILRGPIELSCGNSEKNPSIRSATTATFAGSDAEVRAAWSGSLGDISWRADGSIEFDGFLRIDLELRPDKPCDVKDLGLVVPFHGPAATLYHHANGTWTDLSDAGGIGQPGWNKALPFVPYVWIGNERAGLAWFCESDAGWANQDASRAIEMVRTDGGVDLRIRFIDKAVPLSQPLRFTFGLMATPVKPMPQRWRDWRPTFISALNLEAFAKRGPRVPDCRNIGALWNTHVGTFSYLPADAARMRAKVALLKENGWETVLSYFALNYTQTDTPEFLQLEREWRRNPFTEAGFRDGSNYGAVCTASTWSDFLLWAIAKTMDETGTDGVYLDCCNPNHCQSSEHGCVPGRYPLLANRNLMKRIYALVREKRGPAGFVYAHNSENNLITTYSFTDAVLNGEQYNRKDLRTLTLEKFRAELCPQPYGVPAFLLPTLVKFQAEGKEKMPGGEFLAFPLLHDVICKSSWLGRESGELLRTIMATMRRFGVAEAEFLPYWSNGAELEVSPPDARMSAYLRSDGKAALLIAAAERPADVAVRFQGRLAGLRGAKARDAISGEVFDWEDSALIGRLPDRNVRLVLVGD
ncbi:MAG: LamG domain-containing protein [Rhodopirellula sp.]|nr:LamG domain-containing protein [Rhodopirellula sp.]